MSNFLAPLQSWRKSQVKETDRRLKKLLSQPLILEESGPPRVMTQLVYVGSLLIFGLIVWAAIAEVRESARAEGQVMPSGAVYEVQHLEGGIVAEILVVDGAIVEPGEVLIGLESASAQAELDQLEAREATLALQSERLRAFVLGQDPDFSAGINYPTLVQDQRDIFAVQNQARDNQIEVLNARIDQQQSRLKALADQRKSLERQVAILEEQLKMRSKLLSKGLVSKVVYLETERLLNQTRGELAETRGQAASTDAAVREARGSLLELDSNLRNEAVNEMGSVTAELAQVREAKSKLEDRVDRLKVRAPARGIVKGLRARTVGGIVPAGETIMEIVPYDESLVAEVRISPRDIGHLEIGQEATVNVTTYDTTRFGSIDGNLSKVSASTYKDEEGNPYYKGIIALETNYVGDNPDRNLILPGMVVDVAINTGSKSILAYLLRPIRRGIDGAFTER